MKKAKKRFSRLYDKNINKIYRFVFLKVDSKAAAEDITSRVFTKVWARFRTLANQDNPDNSPDSNPDTIDNPKAYLYQVARAEVANHYRSKPDIKMVSLEDMPQVSVPDPAPNPEQKQKSASDIVAVQQCLAKLRGSHQDILIWYYLDGLSVKEISRIWGKKQGAVRVALHRARQALRKEMEILNAKSKN